MTSAPAPRHRWWAFSAEPWLLATFAGLFVILGWLFPLSGDDWAWGSVEGVDRLRDGFVGYNGRWAGNLAVLLLVRVPLLGPVVVAVTLCCLLRLLVGIAGLRTPSGYLVAAALVIAMPLGIWRQTIVWMSGFSNYALATLGMVAFVASVKRDWSGPVRRRPRLAAALALPLAVTSALFMEHVTIALVLASVANVVAVVWCRRPAWVAAAWCLGTVIGALVMFSNSAYRAVAAGTQGYQGVERSGVGAVLSQGTGGVSQYAVAANSVLNVALAVVIAALVVAAQARQHAVSRWQVATVLSMGVAVAGGAAVSASVDGTHYFGDLTRWSWIPAVTLLLAIVLAARHLVETPGRSRAILLLAAGTLVLIVPMAALNPWGPRNFLPSYVLLSLICLILLRELLDRWAQPAVSPLWGLVGAGVLLSTVSGYLAVYSDIHAAQADRLAVIRQAVEDGTDQVTVWQLPHSGYVHGADPQTELEEDRFKRYYRLPMRLDITFAPR